MTDKELAKLQSRYNTLMAALDYFDFQRRVCSMNGTGLVARIGYEDSHQAWDAYGRTCREWAMEIKETVQKEKNK